jgi:crotonobetainyl-CoA:carnitine CoA-transferase CaiB-like acyl-CoA transferase
MAATSSLLTGVTIGVDGGSRVLRIAARWLADLGADAYSVAVAFSDPHDDEWLGPLSAVPPGLAVDVLLARHGEPTRRIAARHVVRVTGSGETAADPGRQLTEAEACAAGGLAIAIGEPTKDPLPLPNGALDSLVGAHVAAAALASLIDGNRETSIAAADVAAWLVGTNIKMYEPYGARWHRAGRRASGCGGCYPYGLFEASDGLFCLIGRSPEHWRVLMRMIGSQSLLESPYLEDPRLIARTCPDEADRFVVPWIAKHTRHELTQLMIAAGFPGGPVYTCSDVLGLETLSGRWRQFADGSALAPAPPFTIVTSGAALTDRRLDRLRVLDLAWVWSGPAATVALGDLGAHVVKVESVTRPDNTRLRGPSVVRPSKPGVPPLESTEYFHAANRGKHSIALDLKTDDGKRMLRALAEQADVIVENLSPGIMARWGITPETLLETNPACTFISMRGFGEHSSLRDLRAYAPVLTSAAGLEHIVRYGAGSPVGAMTVGFSDALAASHAVLLALAGVYSMIAHGRGAAITLSQFEGAVTANGRNLIDEQHGGARPQMPLTNRLDYVVPGESVAESPWVSRSLFGDVSSRWLGSIRVCSLPWWRDGSFPPIGSAGPELGKDTHLVLREWLGMEKPLVDRLIASGVCR